MVLNWPPPFKLLLGNCPRFFLRFPPSPTKPSGRGQKHVIELELAGLNTTHWLELVEGSYGFFSIISVVIMVARMMRQMVSLLLCLGHKMKRTKQSAKMADNVLAFLKHNIAQCPRPIRKIVTKH